MGANTTGDVEIDLPIDDVFRLTTERVADWSSIVVEERVVEHVEDGPGSRFVMTTEERGQRMEFEGVVTEHEPPIRSAVSMTGSMFDLDVVYDFEDLGGRTRVTQGSFVTPKTLLMKVMFFVMSPVMKSSSRKSLETELQTLKMFCERATAGVSDRAEVS